MLEIIIVIAVVVAFSTWFFVASKPAKRLGEAADLQRQYDIESIEKAIKLVATDSGSLSSDLTSLNDNTPYMIVKAGGSTAGTYTCTATGTSIAKADISGAISSLMPSLPVDPDLSDSSNDTGYYLIKNGNSYNIESCDSYYLAATVGNKQQCGDGYCGSTESCSTCAIDCGACPPAAVCGNGIVEAPEVCDDHNVITEGCLNGIRDTYGTYCNFNCTSEIVIEITEVCDSVGAGGCWDPLEEMQYYDIVAKGNCGKNDTLCASDCGGCLQFCVSP